MRHRNPSIALVGAPVDCGAGQSGCLMGPAAYRIAGLAGALEALGHEVVDRGDLIVAAPDQPHAGAPTLSRLRNLAEVAAWTRTLMPATRRLLAAGHVPVFLGGDHSLAAGTLAGAQAYAHSIGRPQYVLWLDAHADFNTFDSTPSGNLHGTPMAFACGLPGFDALLGGPLEASLSPERVMMLGIRSVDREERRLLRDHGIRVEDMRRIDEHGIARLLAPFLEEVAAADGLLHVSLDVDFLDPAIAPAVGTTVPGGATVREAHLVMEMLHESELVSSLDLVELNPFLDHAGQTARLMVDLAASLFGRTVIDRPVGQRNEKMGETA